MVIGYMHKFIFTLTLVLFIFSDASAAEDPDELYRQGKFIEAEKIYTELDMDHPKDVRYRYNRGCAAFQNSDFQGAMAAFSSVLRRTEDKKVRFKTLYNLGNTAFKLEDFESASDYYRQAIGHDPDDKDAAYNLELSLREIEKMKQKKEEQEKQQRMEENRTGKDEKDTREEERSGNTDKEEKGRQDESQGRKQPEGKKKDKDEDHEDLSGDLTSLERMGDKDDEQAQSGVSLDRKKAEAMLDNINEDRSKFLRFQIPEDKRQGVMSGKDW
ncbi:MAG: tetratricopeptide repeat protein [Deltaproteobacteria bacterium]|nr:tetratricopeptide repeat protein [Deltaproteobacteria bacterium]